MRILVSSHRFAPDLGGIETATAQLTEEWRRLGHEVTIVTASAGPDLPRVHRQPARATLWRLVRDCDVYWHNNISLQTAWPAALARRPWVVTTQTWLHDVHGRAGTRERIKRFALRRARNIFISRSVAAHVALPGDVIGNPYDAAVFRRQPRIARAQELIFVGRLVSDKGADVLLQALSLLAPAERPALTLVGAGPEEPALRAMAGALKISERVTFAGAVAGPALAEMLNAHRVLVVPSRWAEPFGIVALEGLACGCRVIASSGGGLPEAVGPGGTLVPNGNPAALAAAIRAEFARPEADGLSDGRLLAHLAAHAPARVAERYLDVFRAAMEA